MRSVIKVMSVGAVAGAGVMVAVVAMGDNRSGMGPVRQAAPASVSQPAGGAPGTLPQNDGSSSRWYGEFEGQHVESGDYPEWGSASRREWDEPAYGGWSSEPWTQDEERSQRHWGAPRSPSGAVPEQDWVESPVAPSSGWPTVDPWSAIDDGTDAKTAGRPPEPSPAAAAEEASDSAQVSGPVAYPVQPSPVPSGVAPMGYGGYPGYGAGPPPPPPPGWGYGYPGYGAPPGPYGGPGTPRSGTGGGWPWGDMMPWNSRGGGGSPWSNWMPWSNK